MHASLEEFLEQVARRGSWLGGGSVAALSAALSAALLEKLLLNARTVRQVRRLRCECVALIERDAEAFARVIQATRSHRSGTFQRALRRAIDIPCRLITCCQLIEAHGRRIQPEIKPQFRSDLRCALAVARAAREGALALVDTNLAWLNDQAYAGRVRRRLRVPKPPHRR